MDIGDLQTQILLSILSTVSPHVISTLRLYIKTNDNNNKYECLHCGALLRFALYYLWQIHVYQQQKGILLLTVYVSWEIICFYLH